MRHVPLVQQRHIRQPNRDQQFHLLPSAMPSLFPSHATSRFLQVPSLPTRKASSPVPNESFHDISDDLELSFASNMSLNPTTTEERDSHVASPVPMDISPAPPTRVAPPKFITRPRAFTSSDRLFGRDVSNENLRPPSSISSGTGTTSGKKLQRAALPFEWMASSRPEQTLDATDSSQMVCYIPPSASTSLTFRHRITVIPWTSIRPIIPTTKRLASPSRIGTRPLRLPPLPPSPTSTRCSTTPNPPLVPLPQLHRFQNLSESDVHTPQNLFPVPASRGYLHPHRLHPRSVSWSVLPALVLRAETPSRLSIISVCPPASAQDGQFSLRLVPSTLSPKLSLHTRPWRRRALSSPLDVPSLPCSPLVPLISRPLPLMRRVSIPSKPRPLRHT